MNSNIDILGTHFTMQEEAFAFSYSLDVCEWCTELVVAPNSEIGVFMTRDELLMIGKVEMKLQPSQMNYQESTGRCVCDDCYRHED